MASPEQSRLPTVRPSAARLCAKRSSEAKTASKSNSCIIDAVVRVSSEHRQFRQRRAIHLRWISSSSPLTFVVEEIVDPLLEFERVRTAIEFGCWVKTNFSSRLASVAASSVRWRSYWAWPSHRPWPAIIACVAVASSSKRTIVMPGMFMRVSATSCVPAAGTPTSCRRALQFLDLGRLGRDHAHLEGAVWGMENMTALARSGVGASVATRMSALRDSSEGCAPPSKGTISTFTPRYFAEADWRRRRRSLRFRPCR